MSDSVLVIGAGIAGIQAALDLAKSGSKVVLVERGPAIGGIMAALDKNFPTLDCSICIEAPKMREVVEHDNIEVLTLAEVVSVEGEAGDFRVRIRAQPGFVTDECTRCDDCVPVCPEVRGNEFDAGVGARKAIYTPFAQAEPGAYVIDIDACLNEPPNYLPCGRCMEACAPKCIDFTMQTRDLVRDVGAILVATGFELMDPGRLPEYGYGRYPDVLTALEFERLLNAAGPSEGHLVKPSDGQPPESILFAFCIGSRDVRHVPYCSRVCCMYST
ncbi:MAG: FAD-dependent oxidoreductase, partial [Dehalococcoidia bacterium]